MAATQTKRIEFTATETSRPEFDRQHQQAGLSMTWKPERSSLAENYSIVVHSHLRWDAEWQRPQQVMSRLSRQHRILFVQPPVPIPEEQIPYTTLHCLRDYPNIIVLEMFLPISCWEDTVRMDQIRYKLVQEALWGSLDGKFIFPVQWFYDLSAATPFAGRVNECAIVYDCDHDEALELSHFPGPDHELIQRERDLLEMADVVLVHEYDELESKNNYTIVMSPATSTANWDCVAAKMEKHVADVLCGASVEQSVLPAHDITHALRATAA